MHPITKGLCGTYQRKVLGKPSWVNLGVTYTGRRFDNAASNIILPGFTSVNAAIGFQPRDEITAAVRGENLTNETETTNINTSSNYTTVPMAFYFGVEAKF